MSVTHIQPNEEFYVRGKGREWANNATKITDEMAVIAHKDKKAVNLCPGPGARKSHMVCTLLGSDWIPSELT